MADEPIPVTATAADLVTRQLARAADVTPAMRGRFRERIRLDGVRMDADLTGRLLAARRLSPWDGAASVELTFDDHDLAILTSGLLTRKANPQPTNALDRSGWQRFGRARLTLDGWFLRLAGVSWAYTADGFFTTLTFEDEIATLMRRMKGPWKVDRTGNWTRARAMWSLTTQTRLKTGRFIAYHAPEEGIEQRVKGSTPREKRRATRKGIPDDNDLTVAGAPMSDEQQRNAEIILRVADEERAGERATLAALVAPIGESGIRAIPNAEGSNYHGVFQGSKDIFDVNDTKEQAFYFLRGGKGFQAGGAIKAAADHPEWSPGTIAYKVEGSRANFASDAAAEGHYQQWLTEAAAILEAWGGAGRRQVVTTEDYEFEVERKETYWAATDRWAQEVRWRRWAYLNEMWFASDGYLLLFKPTFTLRREDLGRGLRGLSGTADAGMPASEMVIDAGVARWVGAPGSVVMLREKDWGPLGGRWLTANHEQDLLFEDSTITLRRGAPALPEPAAEREIVQRTETDPEAGSARARLMAAAERAYKHRGAFHYEQVRPMPASLLKTRTSGQAPISGQPIQGYVTQDIDCSAFVTLVYKAAGQPNPNGHPYDGSGYTGTLWANGEETHDPQPGDLCFFGDPGSQSAHVNLYAGNGQAYNMGPSAGLSKGDKDVRGDFTGYRTYPLED